MDRNLPQKLARAAFGLVPRPLVGVALRLAAARVAARRPELSERLAPLAGRIIIIDVDEFPDALAFAVAAPPQCISIRPMPRRCAAPCAALIGGSLAAFIALAEGRADGDALFFQRSIRFEGDTEAVLLLRNALDASEIDLMGELLPPLGPLAPIARGLLSACARLLESMGAAPGGAGRRAMLP